jgi:hypothetical protein
MQTAQLESLLGDIEDPLPTRGLLERLQIRHDVRTLEKRCRTLKAHYKDLLEKDAAYLRFALELTTYCKDREQAREAVEWAAGAVQVSYQHNLPPEILTTALKQFAHLPFVKKPAPEQIAYFTKIVLSELTQTAETEEQFFQEIYDLKNDVQEYRLTAGFNHAIRLDIQAPFTRISPTYYPRFAQADARTFRRLKEEVPRKVEQEYRVCQLVSRFCVHDKPDAPEIFHQYYKSVLQAKLYEVFHFFYDFELYTDEGHRMQWEDFAFDNPFGITFPIDDARDKA